MSQRGAFSKVKSPMDDPKFRKDLTDFVEVNSLRRGQKNLTCEDVLDWVREYFDIGVDEEQPYDVRTMNNWLHQLGFVRKSAHKKVTYFDGHEDEKNIEDRKRLWNKLKQYEGKILEIDKQTLELKNEDTAEYIVVYQDETNNGSNEIQPFYWALEDGATILPPKSDGARIMSSDFITPYGYLKFNDEAWEQVKDQDDFKERVEKWGEFRARLAGRILVKEYYNSELCAEDFYYACKAIELNWNGKYKPLFIVDHSPIHLASAPDALNAKHMNLKDGGKQPFQRDTFFYKTLSNGRKKKIVQHMVYKYGPKKGIQKGLITVCTERFGAEAVKDMIKRDLVEMLMQEPDFENPKTRIEEVVEAQGGRVIFGVKFHPELNAIEFFYCDESWFLRGRNIVGVTKGFLERILNAIKHFESEEYIKRIRKYILSALRFLEAYNMEGCTGANVREYYENLKAIEGLATKRTRHRGATIIGVDDEPKPRKKLVKEFLKNRENREEDPERIVENPG